MKKKIIVLFISVLFLITSCFSFCLGANNKEEKKEDNAVVVSEADNEVTDEDSKENTEKKKEEKIKYYTYSNYAMDYHVKIPKSLEGKIIDSSTGNLLVTYDKGIYFKVSVTDIYESLETDIDRKKIDMSSELVSETYANAEYMQEYLTGKISSRSRNRNFIFNKVMLKKIDAFCLDYDICDIESEYDTKGDEIEKITKLGEGCVYVFVYNGYLYTVTIENNDASIADTPQLVKAMESFEIKKSSNLPYIIIAVLGIAFTVFLIKVLKNNKGTSIQMVVEEAIKTDDSISEDNIANAFKENVIISLGTGKEYEWSDLDYSLERLYEWAEEICEEIEGEKSFFNKFNALKKEAGKDLGEEKIKVEDIDVSSLDEEKKANLYAALKNFINDKKAIHEAKKASALEEKEAKCEDELKDKEEDIKEVKEEAETIIKENAEEKEENTFGFGLFANLKNAEENKKDDEEVILSEAAITVSEESQKEDEEEVSFNGFSYLNDKKEESGFNEEYVYNEEDKYESELGLNEDIVKEESKYNLETSVKQLKKKCTSLKRKITREENKKKKEAEKKKANESSEYNLETSVKQLKKKCTSLKRKITREENKKKKENGGK